MCHYRILLSNSYLLLSKSLAELVGTLNLLLAADIVWSSSGFSIRGSIACAPDPDWFLCPAWCTLGALLRVAGELLLDPLMAFSNLCRSLSPRWHAALIQAESAAVGVLAVFTLCTLFELAACAVDLPRVSLLLINDVPEN